MFTGLIEGLGRVIESDGKRVWIRVPFRGVRLGESIAVEGVCLTVAHRRKGAVAFDVGPETRRITTLGRLKSGDRVNLERALRVGDRLGGHWVTGHVEETGRIVKWEQDGPNRWVTISIPKKIRRLVVPKGSLAVDGISLTVAFCRKDQVRIMLIPHTLRHTTLGRKGEGDAVNLEGDILAKYVIREHS